jgi:proline dehydrogenase
MTKPISFDDTTIAFAHLSDRELQDAHWLFSTMQYGGLVKLGTRLTPLAMKMGLPVNGLLRNTIFRQFVGGETLEETTAVVEKLARSGVQVILDYGVEGKEGEDAFEHGCNEFIRVIKYAGSQKTIPFISIKVTGFARFSLLQKLDALMFDSEHPELSSRYNIALQQVGMEGMREWDRVRHRMKRICDAAAAANVGVLVDAEESWIQDPVDALTMQMMREYNARKLVVYNTIQLYRHDRLNFLKTSYAIAEEKRFLLGVKLVRGAYMEKERRRAAERGYASPIQPNREATNQDYDSALQFCMEHLEGIGLIVATHNEQSNLYTVELMQERGLALNHPRVHFSQLYGMSDNITFNLAAAGCNVSKYLPFGPIKDVVPYLMRRAQENTSVKGQTGRELGLIKKELNRRKELKLLENSSQEF